MWDQRYAVGEYLYGKEPKDFLAQVSGGVTPGKVLCLAEGEGRNAIFPAGLDFEHAEGIERDVREGHCHFRRGAVMQIVGRKP